FNSSLPQQKGSSVNVPPQSSAGACRLRSRVGDFQVATDGGIWVAAGAGKRAGIWSVTVSGNWRVTFRFEDGDAEIVDYEDYR
ncbi:MAG TPA: type II toxin-antitoxin system RelE/ParE family toxin, partial [Gammaproteobacteria bacterium]|nr:type II toxin-antitoxin system RelE/ParE family toxin [Gammaproteobacteria bacterium]